MRTNKIITNVGHLKRVIASAVENHKKEYKILSSVVTFSPKEANALRDVCTMLSDWHGDIYQGYGHQPDMLIEAHLGLIFFDYNDPEETAAFKEEEFEGNEAQWKDFLAAIKNCGKGGGFTLSSIKDIQAMLDYLSYLDDSMNEMEEVLEEYPFLKETFQRIRHANNVTAKMSKHTPKIPEKWDGKGRMPQSERDRLYEYVKSFKTDEEFMQFYDTYMALDNNPDFGDYYSLAYRLLLAGIGEGSAMDQSYSSKCPAIVVNQIATDFVESENVRKSFLKPEIIFGNDKLSSQIVEEIAKNWNKISSPYGGSWKAHVAIGSNPNLKPSGVIAILKSKEPWKWEMLQSLNRNNLNAAVEFLIPRIEAGLYNEINMEHKLSYITGGYGYATDGKMNPNATPEMKRRILEAIEVGKDL